MFPKLRSTIILLLTFLVSMTAMAGTNPFVASADAVVSCPTDGSQLSTFTLCGQNDIRTFQVNDPDVQSIQWQLLDASSCGAAMQDCPNLNGTCIWNTLATSSSFDLDVAGEYRVVLTLSNGMSEMFYANANLKTYSDAISETQSISVNGGSNGVLEISVTGDYGPYVHQLYHNGTAGPLQNSPVFTGLSAGLYQIITRDNSGICEYFSAVIELTEPEVLVGQSILTQSPSCIEGGTIEVSASGGVPPYQFSLNGAVYTSSGVFTNLNPGNYSAQVIDVNGAGSTTNTIAITAPQPIVVNQTVYDVTCTGMQNGQIDVEAFGGTGIFIYTLTDAATGVPITFSSPQTGNFIFQNIAPGSYNISVEDSGGCTQTDTVSITEPQPMATTVSVVNVSANGAQDGSITITTAGGVGLNQYAISPNLNQLNTSNVFTGLSVGSYTVLVQDQNGCTNISNVVVTEPTPLTFNVEVIQNASCSSNGAIEVTGTTGGVPPYEYSLDGGAFVATNVFNGLFAGTHTVEVRDVNNATAIDNVIIQDVPLYVFKRMWTVPAQS